MTFWNSTPNYGGGSFAKSDIGIGEQMGAAWDNVRKNELITSSTESRAEAYDLMNEEYAKLTGEEWDNPMKMPVTYDDIAERSGPGQREEHYAKIWEQRRLDMIKKRPELADKMSGSVQDRALQVGRDAATRAETAALRGGQDWGTTAALFGTEFAGYMTDPLGLALMAPTMGFGGLATNTLRGMAQTALKNGALGAAIEGAILPAPIYWRGQQGEDRAMSFGEGAGRVGFGFAGGAGLDILFRGGYRGIQKGLKREAMLDADDHVTGYRNVETEADVPVATGEEAANLAAQQDKFINDALEAGDAASMRAAAKERGIDDEDTNELFDLLEEREVTEEAIRARAAEHGVPEQEVDRAYAQAQQHVDNPELAPMPGPLKGAPAAKKGDVSFKDDVGGVEWKNGQVRTVDGRPVSDLSIDLNKVTFDPEEMQFKKGGDARGVTSRMNGVKKWNPLSANRVFVYERADGILVIADGHQRAALYQRLSAEGKEVSPVAGFVFKESDGWTPGEVKAQAAKKNLQEESGSSMDAATIMREYPELIDDSVPLSGEKMTQARSLSRLSDEAFAMVNGKVVPEHYAAIVADLLPQSPERHAGLLQDLAEAQPSSEPAARFILNDMVAAPMHNESQMNLMGFNEMTRSLYAPRAKIAMALKKKLMKDKTVFKTLNEQQGRIEGAGNTLNKSTNKKLEADAAAAGELVDRLAQQQGRMYDMLSVAAGKLQEGGNQTTLVNDLADEIGGILEREGINGLMYKPDPLANTAALDSMPIEKQIDTDTMALFPDGIPEPVQRLQGVTGKLKPENPDDVAAIAHAAHEEAVKATGAVVANPHPKPKKTKGVLAKKLGAGIESSGQAKATAKISGKAEAAKAEPAPPPPKKDPAQAKRELEAEMEIDRQAGMSAIITRLKKDGLPTDAYEEALDERRIAEVVKGCKL